MIKKLITSILLILVIVLPFAGCFNAENVYTVTFTVDGDTYDIFYANGNTEVSFPYQPQKDGYVFDGWYLGDRRWDPSSLVCEDMTLEAHFNKEAKPAPGVSGGSAGGAETDNSGDTDDSPPNASHMHTPSDWQIHIEATCTAEGARVIECLECGEILSREILGKTEHGYETVTTDATCTALGYTERICKNCGYTEMPIFFGELAAHKYGDWKNETDATCQSEGSMIRECENCGDADIKILPKAEHDMKAPVFSGDGKHISECSECEYSEMSDCSLEIKTKEPTCKEAGYTEYTCLGCENSYMVMGDDPAGHSYKDSVCEICDAELYEFKLAFGGEYYIIEGLNDDSVTELVIPSVYKNIPVKEVAKNAFANNKKITSIYIGENIVIISQRAFWGCSELRQIEFASKDGWGIYYDKQGNLKEPFSVMSSEDSADYLVNEYFEYYIAKAEYFAE